MENIVKTVRVTIEKEIKITVTPKMFGPLTQEQYLAEFCKGLWEVEGMDDVIEYAARMAAEYGGGYSHDGLGKLNTEYFDPDVIFDVISDDVETEIIDHDAGDE